MKKALLLSLLFLTACDQGAPFITPESRPDSATRVEAAGKDMRLYEFTPVTAKHMQCVFVAASRVGGLECFPKKSAN